MFIFGFTLGLLIMLCLCLWFAESENDLDTIARQSYRNDEENDE